MVTFFRLFSSFNGIGRFFPVVFKWFYLVLLVPTSSSCFKVFVVFLSSGC